MDAARPKQYVCTSALHSCSTPKGLSTLPDKAAEGDYDTRALAYILTLQVGAYKLQEGVQRFWEEQQQGVSCESSGRS